jgi:GNAT superfamily N-acetyltransferase
VNMANAVPRRRLPSAIHVIRLANGPADMEIVRELDNAAFPPASRDQQRADPGELEDGVAVGDVYVLERDQRPVAYLHLDRQEPGRVWVSGLAVHPDVQGGGLAKLMMDHFLRAMEPQWRSNAVATVTSPRNHVMLGLLFTTGFAARWPLRDFFGPGRDRFGCQLSTAGPPAPGSVRLVPTTALDAVYAVMDRHRHVVRALVQTESGAQFVMSPEQPGEFLECAPPTHPGGG